jgi:hypothetical protein
VSRAGFQIFDLPLAMVAAAFVAALLMAIMGLSWGDWRDIGGGAGRGGQPLRGGGSYHPEDSHRSVHSADQSRDRPSIFPKRPVSSEVPRQDLLLDPGAQNWNQILRQQASHPA